MSELPIQPRPEPIESDDRFPTGPWEGFFLQPQITSKGPRHWMELVLTFRKGTIQGEGRDRVGAFLIKGGYRTEDGRCWWSKRYIDRHDVFYKGFNEGKGIWGTWELDDPPWRGGFYIWPVGMPDPTRPRLAVAVPVPVEQETAVPVGAGAEQGETDSASL